MTAAVDGTGVRPQAPGVDGRATDWLAGAPTTRRDALVALGCAVAVMAFAVVWRAPVVPADAWHYVRSALEFPSSAWVALGYTRYGMILPSIPTTALFGDAQVSSYVWPVVASGALAAAVYLISRRWWGPLAGVVALVVLFGNSIVIYNLTRGYPDIMSMALIHSAAFCALMARDHGFRGRRAVGWLLAVGFVLGWAFEVRETAMFAWPLVFVLLWRRGTALRTAAIVLLPVLAWAAVDIGISAVTYGDPLLKLHTLAPFVGEKVADPAATAVPQVVRTRVDHLLAVPREALKEAPDGLWMVVSGLVAAAALLVRNGPLRLMSFGFIWIYGLNVLAGGVLLPERPFGTLTVGRYWIQYFPSIAITIGGLTALTAAWVAARVGRRSRRGATWAAAAVVALACVVPVWGAARYLPSAPALAPNGGDALEELRAHLGGLDYETDRVWSDWQTVRILPAYQRGVFGGAQVWSGTPTKFTDAAQPRAGDSVLVYSARDDTCDHCRVALKGWLADHPTVPASWELVYRSPTGNLDFYRVG